MYFLKHLQQFIKYKQWQKQYQNVNVTAVVNNTNRTKIPTLLATTTRVNQSSMTPKKGGLVAIKLCTIGISSKNYQHAQSQEETNEFYKSNTVSNAQNALIKEEKKNIVIQDINKYNADLQAKKKKEEEQKGAGEKKLFKSKSGKLKCVNQGCAKKYIEQENNEDACHFHKGQPVFHDLKKYWTCCGKETFDWDQFMKLPKCCNGFHSPKLA